MPKNITTFYIIRHGQTEWNVAGRLQGHSDSPLTPEGIAQAQKIAQELKEVHFDDIFSSDLLRAQRTAEIIMLERKMAVKTTQLLRERNYGEMEGKPYQQYNEQLQKMVAQYKNITDAQFNTLKIANVETIEENVTRLITFLRETAIAYPGKTLLMVSHGGIMRYLLIHLGFGTHKTLPSGSLQNTALIKLESDGVDFWVKETQGVNKKEI